MAKQNKSERDYSTRQIESASFDDEFEVNVVGMLGYDGQNLQRMPAKSTALKVTEDGTTIYVAKSAPGTLQSAAKWQCMKIDMSSGVEITYAGGNADFVNIATDLTVLSYS